MYGLGGGVTNTEKITAIIDGITIITKFPEFIIWGRGMTYYQQISFCYGLLKVFSILG